MLLFGISHRWWKSNWWKLFLFIIRAKFWYSYGIGVCISFYLTIRMDITEAQKRLCVCRNISPDYIDGTLKSTMCSVGWIVSAIECTSEMKEKREYNRKKVLATPETATTSYNHTRTQYISYEQAFGRAVFISSIKLKHILILMVNIKRIEHYHEAKGRKNADHLRFECTFIK